MKITAFNPLIVSQNSEEIIKVFEDLGFEMAHTKPGIEGPEEPVTSYDLKHPDGFRVNVASSVVVPQDMTVIRMNVEDFDEAYELLLSKGFKNTVQGDAIDTKSSKTTLLISPSGFAINLVQHIKK